MNALQRDIEKQKEILTAKANKKGIYENFGDREVRMLEDKHADGTTGKIEAIQAFEIWCMDYCG